MIICNNFVIFRRMLLLMKKITLFLSALLLSASLVVPAFAASPYDGLAVANVKTNRWTWGPGLYKYWYHRKMLPRLRRNCPRAQKRLDTYPLWQTEAGLRWLSVVWYRYKTSCPGAGTFISQRHCRYIKYTWRSFNGCCDHKAGRPRRSLSGLKYLRRLDQDPASGWYIWIYLCRICEDLPGSR